MRGSKAKRRKGLGKRNRVEEQIKTGLFKRYAYNSRKKRIGDDIRTGDRHAQKKKENRKREEGGGHVNKKD